MVLKLIQVVLKRENTHSAMDKDFFIKIKVSISPYCVWNISYHDDKAKDVAIKFVLDLMITKYILLKF